MEFTLFCRKICFAAIYAVLLRNLFCRGLRTFCVETNHGQNVVRGEKMTYIMYGYTNLVENDLRPKVKKRDAGQAPIASAIGCNDSR